MKELHLKRLENVARALEESPVPKAFDMGQFVHDETDAFEREGDGLKPFECGTPACALGHYGARRDLQRAFRIEQDNSGAANLFGDPRRTVFETATRHFDIEWPEASRLFGPDGCGGAKTAKQAAKFIRAFVKTKRREQKAARS